MHKKLNCILHREKYKKKQAELENNMTFYNVSDDILNALMTGNAQDYKEYVGIASALAVDADKDLLIPHGVMLDRYLENPMMLDGHSPEKRPIGAVTKVGVSDTHVIIYFKFNEENERALEIKKDVDNGFINMFSVGFMLIDQKRIDVNEENNTYTFDYDGKKVKIDLSTFDVKPYTIINKWQLLENSIVTVGSNPQALVVRKEAKLFKDKAKEIKEKYKGDTKSTFVENIIDNALENIESAYKEYSKTLDNIEVKTVVAEHSTPVDLEKSWNKSDAEAHGAIWASADASGDKEKMDWAKYSKLFTWFDSESIDNFGSYKLPHHEIIEGKNVAIWNAVVNAVARLKQTDIPKKDKKGVYDHLAKHAKDADKELIAYEDLKSFTLDELKTLTFNDIEKSVLFVEKEIEVENVEKDAEVKEIETKDSNEYINKAFESINKKLGNIELNLGNTIVDNFKMLNIKLSIMKDVIDSKMVQENIEKEIEKEEKENIKDIKMQTKTKNENKCLEMFAGLDDLFKIEEK